MSDITCGVCAEPYDAYSINHAARELEWTPEQKTTFLRGKGCDACAFGTKCASCNGKGLVPCGGCQGRGHIYRSVAVHISGHPRMNEKRTCPICAGQGTTPDACGACDGTGKPKVDAETLLRFMVSAVESTDDPDAMLEAMGIL